MGNISSAEAITSLSVVVPVYNSERGLQKLSQEVLENLKGIASLELILVDDRSRDSSWLEISKLCASDKRIRGIRLSRNFGQHNATLAGIRRASNKFILTLDDDLQFSPGDFKILEKTMIHKSADLVYGQPKEINQKKYRKFISGFTRRFLLYAIGAVPGNPPSSFRLFRADLREGFSSHSGPVVSVDALLLWSTSNVSSTTVNHSPRFIGKSNYSPLKLLRHAVEVVTSFTAAPLKWVSIIGVAVSLFSFLLLVFIITSATLNSETVPGFPTLAASIAFFAGVQLVLLGVLAEYLSQIHFRVMGKPSYSIDEVA